MYGYSSRVLFAVFANALPGKDAEYNYWCNEIHIPDAVDNGIFNRAHRYKSAYASSVLYLNLWESDSDQLARDGWSALSSQATQLQQKGRIWPVFNVIWSELLVITGPNAQKDITEVSTLSIVQNNWKSPPSDQQFEGWHDSTTKANTCTASTINYSYQNNNANAQPRRFLTLHESNLESEFIVNCWRDFAQSGPSPFGVYQSPLTQQGGGTAELDIQQLNPNPTKGRASRWVSHWFPLSRT